MLINYDRINNLTLEFEKQNENIHFIVQPPSLNICMSMTRGGVVLVSVKLRKRNQAISL